MKYIENGVCTFNKVNIFPIFKCLQTLEIRGQLEPAFNQLIYQNPQISTLILSNWHPKNNVFRFSLPSLKKLELHFDTTQSIEKMGASQVQWPVESLKLRYHCHDRKPNLVGCAALFQMIQQKFAKTLVSLDLVLSLENKNNQEIIRQFWVDSRTCRLDLPNLKKIKLNMSKVWICLDFLLPMRHNLEEISVCAGYGCPVFPKTSVTFTQFYGFEGNMLDIYMPYVFIYSIYISSIIYKYIA